MTYNGTATGVVTQTTTSELASPGYILQGNTNTGTEFRVAAFGLNSSHYGTIGNNGTSTFTRTNYSQSASGLNTSTGTVSQPPTNEAFRYPIPVDFR